MQAHWETLAAIDFTTCEVWTRELTNHEDGFLHGKTHLILDRDTSFRALQKYLNEFTNVKPVLLPAKSPNLNCYIERFFRSLKSECLNRMIFFGEKSLHRAVAAFVEHYHIERNHQALDNQIIEPADEVGQVAGEIGCKKRLGGMLKYYHRDAA